MRPAVTTQGAFQLNARCRLSQVADLESKLPVPQPFRKASNTGGLQLPTDRILEAIKGGAVRLCIPDDAYFQLWYRWQSLTLSDNPQERRHAAKWHSGNAQTRLSDRDHTREAGS